MTLWNSLKIIVICSIICVIALLFLASNSNETPETLISSYKPEKENKKETTILTENQAKGKELFESNCASCHAIDKVKVGPALKGISKRRPAEWIVKFVNNSQKVITSGDPYATKLYAQYNNTEMTAFPSFTKEEVASIVDYVEK